MDARARARDGEGARDCDGLISGDSECARSARRSEGPSGGLSGDARAPPGVEVDGTAPMLRWNGATTANEVEDGGGGGGGGADDEQAAVRVSRALASASGSVQASAVGCVTGQVVTIWWAASGEPHRCATGEGRWSRQWALDSRW